MFGRLTKRVEDLEYQVKRMEGEQKCARGEHKWIVRRENHADPYISCERCFARPDIPKTEGK